MGEKAGEDAGASVPAIAGGMPGGGIAGGGTPGGGIAGGGTPGGGIAGGT